MDRIPVRLNFYRDETADFLEAIVFVNFKVKQPFFAFKTKLGDSATEKEGECVLLFKVSMVLGD
ncbi:MAG: hypothetical protein GTO16_03410 [Candidatus Aminicenantes bacterium]|nr:hypothetical protein [Candidatus Aminicenantes bacterium]